MSQSPRSTVIATVMSMSCGLSTYGLDTGTGFSSETTEHSSDSTQSTNGPPATIQSPTTSGEMDATTSSVESSTAMTDTCPEDCSVCGDGMVTGSEACDNGVNDDAPYTQDEPSRDACAPGCVAVAWCGDGIVTGPESCDDGNDLNEECSDECSLVGCGDGVWDNSGGEGCDDGNLLDGDGCSMKCLEERRVFVTSVTFTGALGGIEEADNKCDSLAGAASGSFKAWLSTDLTSPDSRFDKEFTGLYRLASVDFPIVAAGWKDLTDGGLMNAIDANEQGTEVPESTVYTNTLATGKRASIGDCTDWTQSGPAPIKFTRVGNTTSLSIAWTDTMVDLQPCDVQRRIYCFEDPS